MELAIVSGSLGIAKVAGGLITCLIKARVIYKGAAQHVTNLESILQVLRTAMIEVSNTYPANRNIFESDSELQSSLEACLRACATLVKDLDTRLARIQGPQTRLTRWAKTQLVWKTSDIIRLEERLDRQVNALQLLFNVIYRRQTRNTSNWTSHEANAVAIAQREAYTYTEQQDWDTVSVIGSQSEVYDSPKLIEPQMLLPQQVTNVQSIPEFVSGEPNFAPVQASQNPNPSLSRHLPSIIDLLEDARYTLQGHSKFVYRIAISPDGTIVASSSGDKTVRLWDLRRGIPLSTLEGHQKLPESLKFSPDGRFLASGSSDGSIMLWEGHSGKPLASYKSGIIRLWDVTDGTIEASLEASWIYSDDTMAFSPNTFSPDGTVLALSRTLASSHPHSHNYAIELYDTHFFKILRTLRGHTDRISGLKFSLDSTILVSASWDQTIKIWDTRTGRSLRTIEQNHRVDTIEVCPNGRTVASSLLIREIERPAPEDVNTVKLWDIRSGAMTKILLGHNDYIQEFAFSPDGKKLVSASNDGTVKIWTVPRNRG